MRLGINARFLRKPGTGIGEVTLAFLSHLKELPEGRNVEVFLYVEEMPVLPFSLPPTWQVKVLASWYRRDDSLREHIFESSLLHRAVTRDGCTTFFSLYQSATVFTTSLRHIMLVHDLVPLSFPEYKKNWRQKFHYQKVLQAIKKSRLLVTPSEATAQDIQEKLNIPLSKIHVVPLGVGAIFQTLPTEEKVRETLETFHLTPGYIYHGGGLEVRKNTKRLLEAYALLSRKRNDLPSLVISGKIHAPTNPLATPIEALIKTLGLENRVKLLGFVERGKLPALYRGALFFVYPSLSEGFGLPLLEALALGVPTLTARTTSLPEVGGEAVLYCDPLETTSIEKGIEELLNRKDLRETLSLRGPEQAKQFSWERFTREVASLLLQ